jgi:hypothetical protein
MNDIFVQIASYRDPELVPTVLDLINKAKYPKNLNICIAWQHGEEENIDEIKKLKNVTILDIKYKYSLGACWARSLQQQKYNGEKYTLCLDSHHRFSQDWDVKSIKMIKKLQKNGYKKPLLTTYAPSFNPKNDPKERVNIPWKMDFDRFIPEGAIFFLPASIDNHSSLDAPIPARFLSAHLIFTLGKWNVEVPYDPNYYFHGEEINLAVRSFTHGYDLFHPNEIICWHEYTRAGRVKQWDNDKQWHLKNEKSHLRNRKLFGMDNEPQDIDFEKYGFGTERTLYDYEKYAGISFNKRSIQQYTLDRKNPPNPIVEDWEKSLTKRFKHCIDVAYDRVPEKDYDFWCVVFKDKNKKDIFRKDADQAEILRMKNDPDKYCKIWREFNCEENPTNWVVWPHSISKGWCDIIEGNL